MQALNRAVDAEERAVTYIAEPSSAADEVRRLAGAGELTEQFRGSSRDERRRLRAGAAEIAGPLVYERVSRPIERRRGHYECATTPRRMLPDCLDRFHDDVDGVLEDLFAHAHVPIANLEGWLASRLRRATIEAYRRRRGARGASQRPRVPGWLADALGRDAWLVDLAKAILEWVGTDATAGCSLWPLNAFAERRAGLTGDHAVRETVVAREVEIVLIEMRRRPEWYEKYVERPLGRKQAPTFTDLNPEPKPLPLVDSYEQDETVLRELASLAIEVMIARIDRGEDAAAVAADVLGTVFGDLTISDGLEKAPGDHGGSQQVATLVDDPAELKRIVGAVLHLLGDLRPGGRPSEQ